MCSILWAYTKYHYYNRNRNLNKHMRMTYYSMTLQLLLSRQQKFYLFFNDCRIISCVSPLFSIPLIDNSIILSTILFLVTLHQIVK